MALSNAGMGIFGSSVDGSSNIVATSTGVAIEDGESNVVQGSTGETIPDGESNIVGYLTVPPINYVALANSGIDFGQALAIGLVLNINLVTSVDFGASGSDRRIIESASNAVAFSNQVTTNKALAVAVANTIVFGNLVQRTYVLSISNVINLSGDGERRFFPENSFTIAQAVAAEASKPVTNSVEFNNLVESVNILNVQVANTINFANTIAGLLPLSCREHIFASDSIPEVTFTKRDSILLSCDVDTLELRNPNLGNTEALKVDRAANVSRAGVLTIYRDPSWPEQTTLNLDISTINRAKALETLDFLYNCLGKQITLTDHESRVWVGVIINPDAVIQELDNNDCNYSVAIIFVGSPQ